MTAELALVLPGVVLFLVVLLAAAAAAVAQIGVSDAARAGARAAALGEAPAAVVKQVRELAGPGVQVEVAQRAGLVSVSVSRDLPGVLGMADLRAAAVAVAAPEPGVVP